MHIKKLTVSGFTGKVMYHKLSLPGIQVIRLAPLHCRAWCGAFRGTTGGGGGLDRRVHTLVSQTLQGRRDGHMLSEVVHEFWGEATGGRGLGRTALVVLGPRGEGKFAT